MLKTLTHSIQVERIFDAVAHGRHTEISIESHNADFLIVREERWKHDVVYCRLKHYAQVTLVLQNAFDLSEGVVTREENCVKFLQKDRYDIVLANVEYRYIEFHDTHQHACVVTLDNSAVRSVKFALRQRINMPLLAIDNVA